MLVIKPLENYIIPGDNGIVFVRDHQPPCPDFKIYGDFETGSVYQDQSYNNIGKIIKDHKIDVEHVYMDDYLQWTDFPFPYTCVPTYLFRVSNDFCKHAIVAEYSDENSCFIMMNKRRENRLLVSAWFNQNKHINYKYTQGWKTQDNDFVLLKELTFCTDYSFDGFLNKKFITYNNNSPENYSNDVAGNHIIWNNVLNEKFCSSTFAIVTEPVFWEKAVFLDEKYLMAIYGCCFPIFCGGYGTADYLSNIGFDVFHDVIDHSYQYEIHPGLRVLNALESNREILENHNLKKLDYMDRHLNNLNLVKENLENLKSQFSDSQFEKYFNKVKKYRPYY